MTAPASQYCVGVFCPSDPKHRFSYRSDDGLDVHGAAEEGAAFDVGRLAGTPVIPIAVGMEVRGGARNRGTACR